MKSLRVNWAWILGTFLLLNLATANASVNVHIKGKEAKKIYMAMTAIEEDGAAGHMFRKGKSVFCRYTNADMDDGHGNSIPNGDPRRYACAINFNKNGYATPGSNP